MKQLTEIDTETDIGHGTSQIVMNVMQSTKAHWVKAAQQQKKKLNVWLYQCASDNAMDFIRSRTLSTITELHSMNMTTWFKSKTYDGAEVAALDRKIQDGEYNHWERVQIRQRVFNQATQTWIINICSTYTNVRGQMVFDKDNSFTVEIS